MTSPCDEVNRVCTRQSLYYAVQAPRKAALWCIIENILASLINSQKSRRPDLRPPA